MLDRDSLAAVCTVFFWHQVMFIMFSADLTNGTHWQKIVVLLLALLQMLVILPSSYFNIQELFLLVVQSQC